MPELAGARPGSSAPLRRHLKMIAAQMRVALLTAAEYRVGFWTDAVLGIAWGLAGIIPLLVALEHRPDIAGWSPGQVVMLTGFFLVLSGSFAAFLEPSLLAAITHIRRGSLDYLLLRPVDGLVSCLSCAFKPWSVLEIFAGLVLVVAAALHLGLSPGLADVAWLLASMLAGFAILYALGVLILSLSFRALQLQNLTFLLESLLDVARWPISVFRGPLRLVFTFVLPFAVMTSFPAKALMGSLGPGEVAGALATALVLGGLARVAWVRALRSYTSASS